MKPFFAILLVIIVLGIFAGAVRGVRTPSAPAAGGHQYCPDEKIVNKMPGPGGPKPSYYIFKGERKEIDEFDAVWVAKNCNVPEQVVY
jgi:hypothetical protein